MSSYSEDALIEQPAIKLFEGLGYETANCFYEKVGPGSTLGRQTTQEVVLVPRLRDALRRLNPQVPEEGIQQAVEELTRDRSALHPVVANREVHRLLRDGVRIVLPTEDGGEEPDIVRVIDWNDPESNDFFLASQLWVSQAAVASAFSGPIRPGLPDSGRGVHWPHRGTGEVYDPPAKIYSARLGGILHRRQFG